MDRSAQQMHLKDGRALGFAEYGQEDGFPVIYCHGWPSCRLEAYPMRHVCLDSGIRMIAPDRPGFGLSDFHPGRQIMDFPEDVRQLSAHLGLERFAILGISGGGPYAAACAALIPQQLSAVLLVCSMAPADAPEATAGMVAINRWLLSMARRFPRFAQAVAGICLRAIWHKGEQPIPKRIENRLPSTDREALASSELRQALIASSSQALLGGVRGAAVDGLLYGRPWGFSLNEIRAQVFLWHGEKDVVVPAAMGHYLADNIPGCKARFYPEDGHFSLPFTRLSEILKFAGLSDK
jgi:pimeloyl-ACP methyl ester carboxylesterase